MRSIIIIAGLIVLASMLWLVCTIEPPEEPPLYDIHLGDE